VLAVRGARRAEEGGPVVGVDDVGEREAGQLPGPAAEEAGDGGGGEGDPQPLVEDDDGVDAAREQGVEGGPAGAQLVGEPVLAAAQRGERGRERGQGEQREERAQQGMPGHRDRDDGGQREPERQHGDDAGTPPCAGRRARSRRLPRVGGEVTSPLSGSPGSGCTCLPEP
jgi:hypothetical protein